MENLQTFIKENINEAKASNSTITRAKKSIKNAYYDCGDGCSITSAFSWMDSLNGWDRGMDIYDYIDGIRDINNDITAGDVRYKYYPIIKAFYTLGKEESIKYVLSLLDEEEDDDYIDDYKDDWLEWRDEYIK
jgi:hypothetical protein